VLNIQCDKSGSEDDEMLPDYIKSIADVLANEELCPNKEVLAELRTCWSNKAINAACQLLPIERRRQVENWLFLLDYPEIDQEETPSEDDSEEEEQPTHNPK
jgi:hypothetical protein